MILEDSSAEKFRRKEDEILNLLTYASQSQSKLNYDPNGKIISIG